MPLFIGCETEEGLDHSLYSRFAFEMPIVGLVTIDKHREENATVRRLNRTFPTTEERRLSVVLQPIVSKVDMYFCIPHRLHLRV